MDHTDFDEIIRLSLNLRKQYHELERKHHGNEWTVEEDALAYLTDAGLVGRNVMSQQSRWPKANSQSELEHKLGENILWLIVLANRSGVDIKKALTDFLKKTEGLLNE